MKGFFTKNSAVLVLMIAVLAALLLCESAFLCDSALAQAPGTAGIPEIGVGQRLILMLPMFAIVFMIFWLLVLLPEKKRVAEHRALIDSLKKGESISTSGGLIGRVAGIEKDHILLEIANSVKIKVEPAHVTRRHEK